MQQKRMYVRKEGNLFILRQSCFAAQLAQGREHPNDICAYAGTVEDIRSLAENFWAGEVDYSQIENKSEG